MARRTIDMLQCNMRVKKGVEQMHDSSGAIQLLARNKPNSGGIRARSLRKHIEDHQMQCA